MLNYARAHANFPKFDLRIASYLDFIDSMLYSGDCGGSLETAKEAKKIFDRWSKRAQTHIEIFEILENEEDNE